MSEHKELVLSVGIHNGTFCSRDGGTEVFDTREDAIKWLREGEAMWKKLGYVIWYAKLTHPDGTIEKLREDNCNYNNYHSFSEMRRMRHNGGQYE